jgi:osmotically-inducible protein OsmY
MRSSPRVFWASTLATSVLVGCAATAHHESTGVYFDDATVTSKVKAELIEDPLTKARDISVTTDQGVVHLSGSVDSREQQDEATRLAESVPGVRSVDNGLQFQPPQ